jgi:HK97 gp10 family phage protein
MFNVQITGVPAIDRRLRDLEPRIARKCLRRGMRAGLKIMLARVRALAPQAASKKNPAGGTGALRKAIKIKTSRSRKGIRMAILVSRQQFSKSFYGAFVNEGTRKQKARKFFEVGFKQTAEQAREISITQIMAEIEEVARA